MGKQKSVGNDFVEEAVVGGAILTETLGEKLPPGVRAIEPEYFLNGKLGAIWLAVTDCWADGQPADEAIVSRRLTESKHFEHALIMHEIVGACPTSANLEHWCGILAESGRLRVLRDKVAVAVERAGGSAGFADVAAGIQDAIRSVESSTSNGNGLEHVSGPLKRAIAEIADTANNPDALVIAKTGIVDLDRIAQLRPGGLTIIAGRPGMGKSSLAGNIAAYCARDLTRGSVALFSLEMSAASVICRLLSWQLRMGEQSVIRAVREGKHVSAAAKVHGWDLYVDDRSGIGVADIERALAGLRKVRLVIVDYLQLARTNPNTERQDLRIGEVTKGLKAIAKRFDCHVIALSQLNRGVEQTGDKRPHMHHLRDSGNIEEDADNVWLLYREGYYNPDADGVAEIIIGKQRFGRTGMVRVSWNPETQTFADLAIGGK